MWTVNNKAITMVEGDFGIGLPITFDEVPFAVGDSVKLVVKNQVNGTVYLEKDFPDVLGPVELTLTEEESAAFKPGAYVYRLDWYHEGVFMCNLILASVWKVVDKA